MGALFWGEGKFTLLFVEGAVGSGKSTFIDYYLRCYCPNEGTHQAHFAAKLIINVDFRSTPSVVEFDKRLYEEARQQIRNACTEISFAIEVEDDYEFWNPLFEFNSETFLRAQGSEDPLAFRTTYVNNHKPTVSDEAWVRCALRFLSMKAGSSVCPFQYLVLCLDNLDQSDLEVLQHAIYRVREWTKLAGTMRLWRVFVPVVPGTLSLILEKVRPLPGYEPLFIPAPKLESLLDRRSEVLEAAINGSSDKQSDKPSRMLEFIRDCRGWASPRFHALLRGVSAGSARTSLKLWQCVMSSPSVFETYSARVDNPASKQFLGHYYLMDGMLTAQYPVFRPEHHPLLNIFNVLPESADERDLLIGPHVLALLKRHVTDYTVLVATLQHLGYDLEAIQAALSLFKTRYLFRELKQRAIHPEPSVCQGYWELLSEQAYIEHIAYVTPLEAALLEGVRYRAGRVDDEVFMARSEAAIAFLGQLKQDEERFCKIDGLPTGCDRDDFKKELSRSGIPSVLRICGVSYRNRLVWLRKHKIYSGVSSLKWQQLIESNVLVAAINTPAQLQISE